MTVIQPAQFAVWGTCLLVIACGAAAAQSEDYEQLMPAPGMLEMADGAITARLNPAGCETGYEGACSVALPLQRSEIVFPDAHQRGQSVTYRWDIMVPADFAYNATGGDLRAGRLIASTGASILGFMLESDNGYRVSGQSCFGPEGFGSWHSVEVNVVWDSTRRQSLSDRTPGQLRVSCDGQEILFRSGRPTIREDETARLALGLMGSVLLAEGDNVTVSFRDFSVEED